MSELLEELHKLGVALNANGIVGSDQTCVKAIIELTRLQAENERLKVAIAIFCREETGEPFTTDQEAAEWFIKKFDPFSGFLIRR